MQIKKKKKLNLPCQVFQLSHLKKETQQAIGPLLQTEKEIKAEAQIIQNMPRVIRELVNGIQKNAPVLRFYSINHSTTTRFGEIKGIPPLNSAENFALLHGGACVLFRVVLVKIRLVKQWRDSLTPPFSFSSFFLLPSSFHSPSPRFLIFNFLSF